MQTQPLKSIRNAGLAASALARFQRVTVSQLLIVILAFAVLVRLLAAVYMGSSVTTLPGIHDQVSYDTLARQVLAGNGFTFPEAWWPATRAGEPTAHWSFQYTLFLAAIYAVTDVSPLAARLIQVAIVGIVQPWLAWRIGRRLFNEQVGLVAAALSAGYIYFFYYAAALMTESFYIVGILWVIDLATSWAQEHTEAPERSNTRPTFWLWMGLALGVTVLFRQVFLLFIPFLCLWFVWVHLRTAPARGSVVRTLVGLGIAGTIVVLMILPWTIRNYIAFDRFVLLNTNAGYAFFWGNHPIYGTKFVGILPSDGPSYQDLIPSELRALDEAALDQALLKRGIGFIVDDPQRYVLLSLSRTWEYFKFWPSADSSLMSNISRVFSFGLLAPFALLGLALSARRWHTPQRDNILLLYLFILIYSGIHLLSWALIRYRLPVDAVLIVFAGLSIADAIERVLPAKLTVSER